MNELLWFGLLFANFFAILLVYRLFGKVGLFAWLPFSVIVANIQVLKTVEIFGLTATLGNIVYATSFLATDILGENYTKREAQKAVYLGLFALIFMTGFMSLSLVFDPSPEDSAHNHLHAIFGLVPRIAAASLLAYWISQMHDVWIHIGKSPTSKKCSMIRLRFCHFVPRFMTSNLNSAVTPLKRVSIGSKPV